MGPEDFFLLIQTLPTFWAERILILRTFIFLIFWAPNLGPAWAQLGPGLGPAWAQLKPGWGPAWAQLGQLGHLGWAGAQTPPPAPPAPDELSDPNLTPLPTHPGIKYVARTLAATNVADRVHMWSMLSLLKLFLWTEYCEPLGIIVIIYVSARPPWCPSIFLAAKVLSEDSPACI